MKKILSLLTSVVFLAVLSLAGCTPKSTPTPTLPPTVSGTGMVEVRVTDAPPKDEVSSIVVTASKVEIHRAGAGQSQSQPTSSPTASPTAEPQGGEWITVTIPEGSRVFDLIKIKGIEEMLAKSEVRSGKYTQIRLMIDKIEVALGGGELKPATVPSGELKFVQPFDVVPGEATVIVLDFDADKSVNITGGDKIQVKPVVKISVKSS